MPTPPPRKRFQIHLSTAIVMMFVAGGLIWLQVLPRTGYVGDSVEFGPERIRHFVVWESYGWPKSFRGRFIKLNPFADGTPDVSKRMYVPNIGWERDLVSAFSYNIAVSITILLAVSFLCEWLIRRRAARAES